MDNATTTEEFTQVLSETPDREILEWIALSIFEVKKMSDTLLPQIEALGKSPVGRMLGL